MKRLLIAALAVSALAGCGSSTRAKPAAAAKPAVTAAPTPTHLGELDACQIAIPAARNGATILTDLDEHPDGTTIDQPTLAATIDSLQKIVSYGPPDLNPATGRLLDTLTMLKAALASGQNATIPTVEGLVSAADIRSTCASYS